MVPSLVTGSPGFNFLKISIKALLALSLSLSLLIVLIKSSDSPNKSVMSFSSKPKALKRMVAGNLWEAFWEWSMST